MPDGQAKAFYSTYIKRILRFLYYLCTCIQDKRYKNDAIVHVHTTNHGVYSNR